VLPLGDLNIAFVPVNELAAAAIILLASFRRPRFRLPLMVPVVLVALWLELVGSGLANDVVNIRRLGHLAIAVALVVVIGQGRVHLTSLARGIGLGLAIGIPVSLPSIVTGGYPGRLTGLFGDPNGAGMLMVTMTPLVMGVVRGRWRWLVGLLGAGGVLLTFSRTSLLALAFVLVWMLVASRLSLWLGAAILGPVAVLVAGQLESLRLAGPFAARQGSDLLRGAHRRGRRPDARGHAVVRQRARHGAVTVQNLTFFLHNAATTRCASKALGGPGAPCCRCGVRLSLQGGDQPSRGQERLARGRSGRLAHLRAQPGRCSSSCSSPPSSECSTCSPRRNGASWCPTSTRCSGRSTRPRSSCAAGLVGDDDFVTRIQQSEGSAGRPRSRAAPSTTTSPR
jgi:hypothetical protein